MIEEDLKKVCITGLQCSPYLFVNQQVHYAQFEADKITMSKQHCFKTRQSLSTVEICDVKGRNHGQAREGGKSSKKGRLMEKQIARR